MAHQRPRAQASRFRLGILRHLPFRRFSFAPLNPRTAPFLFRRVAFRPRRAVWARQSVGSRARAIEHGAHLLGHDLAHDLGHALAEADPTPLGVALYWIGTLVVRGHILGAIARQGADKSVL